MKDDLEFTLEDILEEERQKREARERAGEPLEQEAQETEEYEGEYEDYSAAVEEPREYEDYVPEEEPGEAPVQEPEEEYYAPEDPGPEYIIEEEPQPQKGKKKKKKRWGLFGRRKVPDFDENEEDIYYGIQLKPIDEYRMDGDAPPLGEEGYKVLFDDSKQIDDEVEENFQKLQKERRRRVAEAVQSAGMDEQQVEEEFGVVAPVPVTSYSADPYARQHGLDAEGGELSDLQKAMLQTDQTMEIKLNVLNSTVELQKLRDGQPVSEETVERILREAPEPPEEYVGQETAEYEPEVVEYEPEPEPETVAYEPEPEPEIVEYEPEPEPEIVEYVPEPEIAEYVPEPQPVQPQPEELKTIEIPVQQVQKVQQAQQQVQHVQQVRQPEPEPEPAPEPPRPIQQVPYVEDVHQYRSRSIATHIINADLLQSALLSEEESLQRAKDAAEGAPRRRIKPRKTVEELPPEPEIPPEKLSESIEDYTGPEDARSISSELKENMGKYSLTMMITGVCTVILAVVSLVCRSQFTPKSTSWPLAYVVLSLVLLTVSAGMSYKTVGRGLKGLFAAKANADSGVAVAAVAALVQALSSVFFRSRIAEGGLYLYAPVVSALLFMNAAGNLTMLRRIHSNFRFVTSREQKYAVRLFDDYNTSLKMTKDCVAEKPLVAYQCKTGFLKRFLDLSYAPDPSETSSQLLAPLGLISSLILCIACLLITKDVPMSISALAAACCACVAAGNMLTVNMPISNLCKTVRRAGGMIVGHKAVETFGDVNAVIADAGELFPTGTVVISGIKQFGTGVLAEDAIMCATALVREAGGPLLGVFEQVISDAEETLPEVERYTYESGGGMVGRVDGRTVYIGNRALLMNHRIEPPPRELEVQHASGGKDVLYLALDAEVAAMLVLTYSGDRRKKNELQRMEDSGISVLVRTTDPNVTVAQVSKLFGVDPASVGILDGQMGDTAKQLLTSEPPRADATAATKGRMESMMSLVAACVEQKRTTGLLVAVQSAAAVLGFVLVAFLSCFGEIRRVSALILFIFQIFWTAILLLLPKFRR